MSDPLLRAALRGSPLYRDQIARWRGYSRASHPEHARDAGTGYSRREATILFADLCGFSSIAAAYPPEVVLGVLSRCLGMLTEVIMRHYGTRGPLRRAGSCAGQFYVQMCLQGERPEAKAAA
jgi:class 3 adenylate cyclase